MVFRKSRWQWFVSAGLGIAGLISIAQHPSAAQTEILRPINQSCSDQNLLQTRACWTTRLNRALQEDPSDAIGHLLTSIGGLGILLFWLFSLRAYQHQKHWERVRFTLEQIKEFEENTATDLARKLIDANGWVVKLQCDEQTYYISDAHVALALEPYRKHNDGFSAGEIEVRKSFDSFLESMERFSHLIETGLIRAQDLYPYIHYWLDVIGGSQAKRGATKMRETEWKDKLKDSEWRKAVFCFADSFGYAGFRKLMKDYGYCYIPTEVTEVRAKGESNCCLVNPDLPKATWKAHLLINNADFSGK